ncbi:acid-thiol ligase [Gracilaria domingensis]|nr:acid-thiol ligase [Gracilaria domingensis]
MHPVKHGYKRSESLFHQKLTVQDREDLLKLQTLRDLPKSRYATRSCITAIPSGRGRKAVFSHIEVYKMVEEIATDLREAGVRPQTPCAYVLENCVEAVIYFLALQWIGAIAVPIDPQLSENDIGTILRAVKAVTLVSTAVDDDESQQDPFLRKIQTACENQGVIHWYVCRSTNRGVYLDRKGKMAGEGAAWSGGAGDFKYDPNEKCVRYAIGVDGEFLVFELSHRGAAEATREFSKTYSLTAEDTTILVDDIHSMHGLMAVLASIYSGGNVVISQGTISSVSNILQYCNENGVTWISAESKLITEMNEEVERDKLLKEGLSLSFLRSYGGNIQESLIQTMETNFRAPVLQAYGTPETCGLVSSNRDYELKLGTCGKAISGCDILIFDMNQGEAVQANTHGRIGVRGPHVSMYYMANDYANQACYIELLEGESSGYYFLTGDEGFVDDNGFLTVSKHNDPSKRAAMLAAQKEDELKSQRDFEAARAAQLDEEERRRTAETKFLEEKRAKEKEEAERLEVERKLAEEKLAEEKKLAEERIAAERKLEMERKLEEERLQKERLLEDERQKEAERQNEEEGRAVGELGHEYEISESTRHSDKLYQVEAIREVTKIVETEKVPDEIVKKIMERLDTIEARNVSNKRWKIVTTRKCRK